MANSSNLFNWFGKFIAYVDQFTIEPDAEFPTRRNVKKDSVGATPHQASSTLRNDHFNTNTLANNDISIRFPSHQSESLNIYISTPFNDKFRKVYSSTSRRETDTTSNAVIGDCSSFAQESSYSKTATISKAENNNCSSFAQDKSTEMAGFSNFGNSTIDCGNENWMDITSIHRNDVEKCYYCKKRESTNKSLSDSVDVRVGRSNWSSKDFGEPCSTFDHTDVESQSSEKVQSSTSVSTFKNPEIPQRQQKSRKRTFEDDEDDDDFKSYIHYLSETVTGDMVLSDQAEERVETLLLNVCDDIAQKAGKLAAFKKRKTIKIEDIDMAMELYLTPSITKRALNNAKEQIDM